MDAGIRIWKTAQLCRPVFDNAINLATELPVLAQKSNGHIMQSIGQILRKLCQFQFVEMILMA